MTTDNKLDLRFLVRVEKSPNTGEFLKFHARIVYIGDRNEIRYPSATWAGSLEAPYADFAITAQANTDPTDRPGRWYAVEVGYTQPYDVDLRRAEVMVKFLRKLQRGLDRLAEDFGRVDDDPAALMARAAKVLGITRFAMNTPRSHQSWMSDAADYDWTDFSGIEWRITSATEKLLPSVPAQ